MQSTEMRLVEVFTDLDDNEVYDLVLELRKQNRSIKEIQDVLNEGMRRVGDLYKQEKYFISDLIFSGVMYSTVLAMPEMQYRKVKGEGYLGVVVIGTVKDDMHDLGKSIFVSALSVEGFNVIDLGVDVSKMEFVNAVRQYKPDILALSGIMSFAQTQIKEIIETLKKENLVDGMFTIVGGSTSYKDILDFLGADAYGEDAFSGVDLCLQYIREKYGK